MPSRSGFTLHGLKELDEALKQLPKAVGRSVIRKALTKSGKPVLEAARANVPRRTGKLAESLAIRTTLTRRQRRFRMKAGVEVYIGATYPSGAHAHLIEFGTINQPPRPFLRPAWDENRNTALASIKQELWEALKKAARTLARKAEKGTLGARAARELLQ